MITDIEINELISALYNKDYLPFEIVIDRLNRLIEDRHIKSIVIGGSILDLSTKITRIVNGNKVAYKYFDEKGNVQFKIGDEEDDK